MKRIETKEMEKAIYSYDIAIRIFNNINWGDDDPEIQEFFAIWGEDVDREKYTIKSELSENVMYIFRWNKNGTNLVPYHVSYREKTIRNLEKGSRKYGFQSILNECVYES